MALSLAAISRFTWLAPWPAVSRCQPQHELHEVVIRRRLLALEAALEALGPGHDLFELGGLGDHHVDRFLP